MNTLFLTVLLQSFLPLFDRGPNDYIGLSFVNSAESAAIVEVSATDGNTGVVSSGRVSLSPGEQRALLLEEILSGAERPDSGWIRVDSGVFDVDVVLAHGDPDRLAIAKPLSPATSLLLSDVRIDTGFRELGHTDTLVTLVRPGGFLPAGVTLELIGLDGVSRGSVAVTLAANRNITLRISDIFRDVLPDNGAGGRVFEGYLRLSAGAEIVAWQRVETPLFGHILDAEPVPDPTTTYLAPFFVFGGGYRSTLNLVNPTDETITVELIAQDGSGGVVGELVQRTLGPGEGIRSDVQDLFGVVSIAVFPAPVVDGYVRLRETGGQAVSLIGSLEVASIGQGTFTESSMVYPIGPASTGPWVLPLALGGSTYYSGLAMANPNERLAVQTEFTIEVVQSDGTVLNAEEVSLSPGRQHTAVVAETLQSGYVRISSNMPLGIVGALGTRDSRLLEQIPVIER